MGAQTIRIPTRQDEKLRVSVEEQSFCVPATTSGGLN